MSVSLWLLWDRSIASPQRTLAFLPWAISPPDVDEADRGRNLTYPITGFIGVGETVETFLRIEALTALAVKEKGVMFSDEIKFTTTLDASVAPTIKLQAVSTSLKVTNLTLTPHIKRSDKHNLTVVLYYEAPKQQAAPRGAKFFAATALPLRRYAPIVQNSVDPDTAVRIELERLRTLRERLDSPRLIDLQLLTP